MTIPSKDIDTLYASYQMPHHDYIEMTENETYTHVKRKWLIFRNSQTLSVQPSSVAEPQRQHSRQPGGVEAR